MTALSYWPHNLISVRFLDNRLNWVLDSMIARSIPMMTAFDLGIIGCVVFTLIILWRRRAGLPSTKLISHFTVLGLGLSVLALFHVANLATIHVFPLFMAHSAAMAAMEELHLHYSWIVSLFGIGLVALGLLLVLESTYRLNDELRGSEEKFRKAFESAGVGMVMRNVQDQTLIANEAFQKMVGYSQEELERMHIKDITHPDDPAAIQEAFQELRAGKTDNIQVTRRNIHKNGESVWIVNDFSLIRDAQGEPAYTLSLCQNITELKEAERLLGQAQKMEVVGQLTTGIAHDFNNLLAACLGNVELAQEEAQRGGDVQPFLEIIKRASQRGAVLTGQLLAFSRKQMLFPEVLHAGELVGGVTNLLTRTLGATYEIKVTGDDDLWPCVVDPHQLESAVLNLAINARDAMPDGGSLTLQTMNVSLDDDYAAAQTEVEPGEYVLVAVTDSGTGMPKEVINQVFDPFFTTKGVGLGSGLGLSMVYGFVKQSHGHVTIYSEEGEGTTIKLYLPRAEEPETQPTGADQKDLSETRGETVLVVEDDPDVRTLSVAILSSLGYEILEAADGETALKVLETAPRVNLLFTDVVLPGGMGGPELAREVQSRFPGIAVLFTSGYTDLANVDRSALGEETELLKKPYRKADLARTVRLVLDQAKL
jgi:PAS domain S-box-containing protein